MVQWVAFLVAVTHAWQTQFEKGMAYLGTQFEG